MKLFLFFVALFVITLSLSIADSDISASVSYHGVVLAETQDYEDSGHLGHVKAFNLFWAWYAGSYTWTGLDWMFILTRTRTPGAGWVDSDSAQCGSQYSAAANCSGPGSDVWTDLPTGSQWITSYHAYDNYPADGDGPVFHTGYLTPLSGTAYYMDTY